MDEHTRQRLREVFSRFPAVDAVFLFGSSVPGRVRRKGDLDLALVPRAPTLRERRLDLLEELTKAGFDDVDLVILDTDDVVQRFEAVSPNQLIYSQDDFDRGGFYSKVIREYFDLQPILEIQRAAVKRRLQGA